MFKSKALLALAILVIALTVVISSCAPSAPAAPAETPSTPAAAPAAPETTPPATPSTPAATPEVTPPATPSTPAETPAASTAPAVTHSWGDSTTYTNDTVGFTVDYPAKWKTETPGAATAVLQIAADPTNNVGDRVYVDVIPAATDLSAAAKNLLDVSSAFQQYHVTATVASSNPFTLTCGSVTSATATELTAKIVIYNFYFYAIGATKGGNSVNVMGATIGGGNAKKQIQEICQTLCFK